MTDTPTPLDRKLSITIGEQPVDLFMSYGLLDILLKKFAPDNTDGGVEQSLFNDNRDFILTEVMVKRGKYGVDSFDLTTSEITPTTVVKICQWVMEHVLDFFLQSGEAAKAVAENTQKRIASLAHSESGSAV